MSNSYLFPPASNPESYDIHNEHYLHYWRAHALGINASRILLVDQNPLVDVVVSQEADKSNLRADSERMLQLSNTDPLTGLFNRRGAERAYQSLLQAKVVTERRSNQQPPSAQMLVLDLDDFKSVNEQLGHQAGDDLLQVVGAFMAANTRSNDVVARWGGDEFVILLPRTPKKRAYDIAEKIRKDISRGTTTSVSIGVGEVDYSRSLEETVSIADAALANAKQTGKNVVVHIDDMIIDVAAKVS
ncbi:MAG: GGDEF domain-containing protein [Patescibacteria group bacterium]|nr:GGDEF domain-containing protein [Patescibacteria group bacterium]